MEIVQLRRNTVQHASEIQFLASILEDLDSFSAEKLPNITYKLRERISHLQTGHSGDSDQTGSGSGQGLPQSSINQEEGRLQHRLAEAAVENTDPPLLTAIEHLAWGRNSAGCFPHRRCGCQYRRDNPEQLSMVSDSFHFHGSTLESLVQLPKPIDAQKLINFHITYVTWHHNCFHSATFLEQCELFWKTGKCGHPLWIALYLSVLSSTVNSIQHSAKSKGLTDVDLDAIQSVQQLFSAMVQTLYSSHFLNDLSIYSVQAIVISTEVAHNLGLSQLNATLFNAAVRIAECLGIHKIKNHTTNLIQTPEDWEDRVEREVGRRVWCQMVIQDHFAIPFTDTYSISPMHYSTSRPMNADDHDLAQMPDHMPTISTYVRVLVTLAALMPGLVDGLGPMNRRKPHREQYEHILRVDQRMRAVVKNIPSFLLRPDTIKEAQVPWLSIARRSLAITAAEKIIMIHRLFLFRSFHDTTYNHSRRTCVAAAMTILREHEAIVNSDDLSIWTHTAFAITAAVILCFEVNTSMSESSDADVKIYRTSVLSARDRLAARQFDVLAQRGVALIDAIFITEQSSLDNSKTKQGSLDDFGRIFSAYSTLSKVTSNPSLDEMAPAKPPGHSPEVAARAEADEIQLAWDEAEIDFDAWFNGVFSGFQSSHL